MSGAAQLALPFDPPPRFEPADLIEAPSNAEARAWLARTPEWPLRRLALWGPPGCGKTHLLHAWAQREGADILRGPDLDPDLIPGLPDAPLAIDDAAAATTHVHRDGTTLMSYAGPLRGAVTGRVSRADGEATWTFEPLIECMFGPLNLIVQ
jgi:hypothetical protein